MAVNPRIFAICVLVTVGLLLIAVACKTPGMIL